MTPPAIILVDPTLADNVGAVARAMKNMGFPELRIVDPDGRAPHLAHAAHRMAAGSGDVLENARVFDGLHDALSDLQVTVGCTARRGKGRHPLLEPADLPGHLDGLASGTRTGIVFGREDRGLTNPELDLCTLVSTIPTAPEHTSLNLAQAVLLVCYEIRKGDGRAGRSGAKRSPAATCAETEGLYRHAREVLLRIGFLDPQNPDRILRVLRRILGRAGVDTREVTILRGILRQMDWYAGRGAPERDGDCGSRNVDP